MTKIYFLLKLDLNRNFSMKPLQELVTMLRTRSDSIFKVVKLWYDIFESGNHLFATYYTDNTNKLSMS